MKGGGLRISEEPEGVKAQKGGDSPGDGEKQEI